MLYDSKNPHGGDIYGQKILLDYSANTNPYGTPQGVLDAVVKSLPLLHHYPDPYCRELVKAISEYENVPQEFILCGNGAAELIYAWCEAMKPSIAVELAPTFAEYSLGLERVGCKVERYYLNESLNFAPDKGLLDFLAQQKPDALVLCNPNNPTGQLIEQGLLEKVLTYCKENGIAVLLDECFMDLTGCKQSYSQQLSSFPNLTILKAFTKSFGMAGLRLGYCLSANSDLLRRMSASVQPWNISTPAQMAGVAALQEKDFLAQTIETIAQERQWLSDALSGCGIKVYPSYANYLLFFSNSRLHNRLRERGIAIRDCSNYFGLGQGWYRIAVRLRHQNEMLMEAIRQALAEE